MEENKEKHPQWWKNDLIVIGFGALALAFIAIIGFLPEIGYLRYYIDGYSINRRAVAAPTRVVLWETPAQLPGKINELYGNHDATISADGKTIILSRLFSSNNHELYISRKEGKSWTKPVPIVELNTPYDDMGPEMSRDGRFLFFYSNRPGGQGAYDIWVSVRKDKKWTKPVNLGPDINTKNNEIDPAFTPDGMTLFFSSDRPDKEDSATEQKNSVKAKTLFDEGGKDFDIYKATVKISQDAEPEDLLYQPPEFNPPTPMVGLNSDYDEGKVTVTVRGGKIYFSSNRPGGYGGFDLYRSYLYDKTVSPPENFGFPVNSESDEVSPALTLEGFKIYFCSNRRSRKLNDFQLYDSMSREVMVKYDYTLLMAVLIIIVTILAVYYLLRLMLSNVDMNMLTKCLLLSLLLHLLLIALSSSWYIKAKIDEIRDRAANEMTININNLARESISMAIREGVASLPKVSSSSSASRPAASMSVPSMEPVRSQSTSPSEQKSVSAVAKSIVAPISMAQVENVTGSAPASDDSSVTAVAPMLMGDTGLAMEMPKTKGQGDGKGDSKDSIKPGGGKMLRQPEKQQPRKKQFEVAQLAKTPMEIDPTQVTDTVKNMASKNAPGSSTVDSLRKALEQFDSSTGVNNADPLSGKVSLAANPGGVKSSSSSVGMLMFPAGLKMEVVKDPVEDYKERKLDLLKLDPYRVEAVKLELDRGESIYIPMELLKKYEITSKEMPFNFYMPWFILKKMGLLKRVGGLIYSDTPRLSIPADTELEVPEEFDKNQ